MLEFSKHRANFDAKNPITWTIFNEIRLRSKWKLFETFGTYISDLPDFSQDLIASDLLLDAIATATAVKSMYFLSADFYSPSDHTAVHNSRTN